MDFSLKSCIIVQKKRVKCYCSLLKVWVSSSHSRLYLKGFHLILILRGGKYCASLMSTFILANKNLIVISENSFLVFNRILFKNGCIKMFVYTFANKIICSYM